MSSAEEDRPDREAFADLDDAVSRTLERLDEMETRVREVSDRAAQLEGLLERFRAGEEDPAEIASRAERLREENRDLRDRLARGRKGVERLLARIRFLEEQR